MKTTEQYCVFFSSTVLVILPVVKQCSDFVTNSHGDPGTYPVKNHKSQSRTNESDLVTTLATRVLYDLASN